MSRAALHKYFTNGNILHLNILKNVSRSSSVPAYLTHQPYSQTSAELNVVDGSSKAENRSSNISKAMKAYLERSVQYDKFMKESVTKYEIGKRHLANMMGEDPETFTQDDIDEAIAYLFPSGLYEPKARPSFKHPAQIFAAKKEAEFDESGRPFRSLFYTSKPTYYSLLQEIAQKSQKLEKIADQMTQTSTSLPSQEERSFANSKWFDKIKFEEIIKETVNEQMYMHFVNSMERLLQNPWIGREREFVMRYRLVNIVDAVMEDIPTLLHTPEGRPFMNASGTRKTSTANVIVYGNGTGKFTVNGGDILYFDSRQDRHQIMFPLQMTGNLSSVDVEATVTGGGKSGQAGAIRYALAVALRSFVSSLMVEKMRIAGLLTRDRRKLERQKPGQRGARAKYTWKKR